MRSKKGTYTEKVQATITGYPAWAFAKLVAAKGQKPSDVARSIFERWVEENPRYLEVYGISPDAFERHVNGAPVVELSTRRNEK